MLYKMKFSFLVCTKPPNFGKVQTESICIVTVNGSSSDGFDLLKKYKTLWGEKETLVTDFWLT